MNIELLFNKLINILYSVYYRNDNKYIKKKVNNNINEQQIKKTNTNDIINITKYIFEFDIKFKFKVNDMLIYKVNINDNNIFLILNLNNNPDYNRKLKYFLNSNFELNNFLLGIINFDLPYNDKISKKFNNIPENYDKKFFHIDITENFFNNIILSTYLSKNIEKKNIYIILFNIFYLIYKLQKTFKNIRINNLDVNNILVIFLDKQYERKYFFNDNIINLNSNINIKIINLNEFYIENIYNKNLKKENKETNSNYDLQYFTNSLKKYNFDYLNEIIKDIESNDYNIEKILELSYFKNLDNKIIKGGNNINKMLVNNIEMSSNISDSIFNSSHNSSKNSNIKQDSVSFNESINLNSILESDNVNNMSENKSSSIDSLFIDNSNINDYLNSTKNTSSVNNNSVGGRRKKSEKKINSIRYIKNNSSRDSDSMSDILSTKSNDRSRRDNRTSNSNHKMANLFGTDPSKLKNMSNPYHDRQSNMTNGNIPHNIGGMEGMPRDMIGMHNNMGSMEGYGGMSHNMSGMPPNMGGMSGMPPNMGSMSGMPHNMGGMDGMPTNMGGMDGMPHNMGGMDGMPHNMGGMPHGMSGMPPNMGSMSGMPQNMSGMPQNMSGMSGMEMNNNASMNQQYTGEQNMNNEMETNKVSLDHFVGGGKGNGKDFFF